MAEAIAGTRHEMNFAFSSARFLELSAFVDTRVTPRRSVLEQREHIAAIAAVKGSRWYAKRLLCLQEFPNTRVASRALIQSSRKKIEESHARIVRTKNILAFSRCRRSNVS